MPIHYTIDKTERVVYQTAVGRGYHRDFEELIDRLAEDEDFKPGMRLLCDYSKFEFNIPADEVEEISQQMKKLSPAFTDCQLALVSAGDLEYGLMRMFSLLSSEAQFEARVFRKIENAREWLRLPAVSPANGT